jgi:hypothetical protein
VTNESFQILAVEHFDLHHLLRKNKELMIHVVAKNQEEIDRYFGIFIENQVSLSEFVIYN